MTDSYDAFQEDLLLRKKALVITVVKRICKRRKLPLPEINFGECEGDSPDQLGHYHPDENKICISKTKLIKQTYDDLEDTAAHEVAHILEHEHGPRFDTEEVTNRLVNWQPPGNIPVITEGQSRTADKKTSRPARPIKYKCNYHLCGKRRPTTKCKLCEKYFCAEHRTPIKPYVGNVENHQDETNGHPCMGVVMEENQQNEKTTNEFTNALKQLTKKRSVQPLRTHQPSTTIKKEKKRNQPIKQHTPNQDTPSQGVNIEQFGIKLEDIRKRTTGPVKVSIAKKHRYDVLIGIIIVIIIIIAVLQRTGMI
jgi:predicted SprT family Zn-dependent metalloprotease